MVRYRQRRPYPLKAPVVRDLVTQGLGGGGSAGRQLANHPQRIVSLVPSHTETVCDFGLGKRIVGRTRFCIHPAPQVQSIPHVGGTKDASLEKILRLEPDIVLADKDENPKALVEALEEAGVPVLWSAIDTLDDVEAWLSELAQALGVVEIGQQEVQRLANVRAEIRQAAAAPVGVFCPIWYDPWMTFDATAYPHAVLAELGFVNAFADHEGPKYFEVTPREVEASNAQWTLLPTEPYPFHKRLDAVNTTELGPAGTASRVVLIDGEALTWFGTRAAAGLQRLREQLSGLGQVA